MESVKDSIVKALIIILFIFNICPVYNFPLLIYKVLR